MRGRQSTNPSHELMPGVVIDKMHTEAGRLLDEADRPFGVDAVVAPDGSYLAESTEDARVVHDRARYKTLGKIINIAVIDPAIIEKDADPRDNAIKVTVQTAVPQAGDWLNSYIEEGFAFHQPGDFYYDLGVTHYTETGQAIIAASEEPEIDVPDDIPDILDLLREVHGMSKPRTTEEDMNSPYKGLAAKDLETFKKLFPELMKDFQPVCTFAHFRDTLRLIKNINPEDEIGASEEAFVRD